MQIQIEDWSFWTPLFKAVEEDGRRQIKGIASTEDRDLQGEIVQQGGIDFSYFLKYGFFNNDHGKGFGNKVGQPTVCKHAKKGLYVEGFLFNKHKIADEIWELIQALKASDSDRQVGMSVQGKTRKRAGNVILKCWVQDIAITPAPINTKTWIDILKSFAECSWCSHQGTEVCLGCGSCSKAVSEDQEIDEEEEKALSVGHGNPSATGGVSGEALRVESLDSDAKDLSFGKEDRKRGRRLSKSEVTNLIQESVGYSYPTSALYTDVLFKLHQLRSMDYGSDLTR